MSNDWMFYTDIKQENSFVDNIIKLYNSPGLLWEDYQSGQTAMHDGKGYEECISMQRVSSDFIQSNSSLYDDFYKFINFTDDKFPMKIMLSFVRIKKGNRFTPHYDNPKCAIIYHFGEPDPLEFYNEKNENIFSIKYKFSLLNTAVKHGVDRLENDRAWFKVSINNYGYYQLRELLYKNNLIKA